MRGLAKTGKKGYYPDDMRALLRNITACLLVLALAPAALPASADDGRIVTIETRRGVTVSFYYMKQSKASATIILLPGGKGDIKLRDGAPDSDDFLVRSRGFFFANGFNVAVVDKPDDVDELNFRSRITSQHTEDIRQIASFVKDDCNLPVWLVGTSRGTISATAAAVSLTPGVLNGIVLTSSITSIDTPGAVLTQDLSRIHVPVLVVHHEDDRCTICDPNTVPEIIEALYNSPVRKSILIGGGWGARGNACGPQHHHGYVGVEKKVVALISHWIQNPSL